MLLFSWYASACLLQGLNFCNIFIRVGKESFPTAQHPDLFLGPFPPHPAIKGFILISVWGLGVGKSVSLLIYTSFPTSPLATMGEPAPELAPVRYPSSKPLTHKEDPWRCKLVAQPGETQASAACSAPCSPCGSPPSALAQVFTAPGPLSLAQA